MTLLKTCLAVSALALTAAGAQAGEIAVIVKTTNSNFWQNVNLGAQAAIEGQSEHTLSFDGPAAESVAGLVLAPSDPEALIPVVQRAYESGIPVVIIDSALGEGAEGAFQAFLSTDNCAAGEQVAKRMIDEAGTTGKVGIMSYVAGVGSEIGRVGCFTTYLQENSDLEIVGPLYSQSQMANALNQTTDMLASNPDLVGIFGANEPTAVGMGRAIEQAGKAGQLTALGFDGNEDLQQFVRDGVLTATAVQGSFAMGEMGVQTVMDILAGETVEPFINTGVVMVDKANIESDEARNVLY